MSDDYDNMADPPVSIERENEDLRTAMELLAVEVAWRRKVGYCPNQAFENVSNNQTCRTALTDAGCSPVEMQDRKDTIIAVLRAEVIAWRDWRKLVMRYMTCEQPDPIVKIDALKAAIKATDAAKALEEP